MQYIPEAVFWVVKERLEAGFKAGGKMHEAQNHSTLAAMELKEEGEKLAG